LKVGVVPAAEVVQKSWVATRAVLRSAKAGTSWRHPSTEAEDEVDRGLLVDPVVGESAAFLELLASKDEPLLIWGSAFLVVDLGFDLLDGIVDSDFESDDLGSFDENLDHGISVAHAGSKLL